MMSASRKPLEGRLLLAPIYRTIVRAAFWTSWATTLGSDGVGAQPSIPGPWK